MTLPWSQPSSSLASHPSQAYTSVQTSRILARPTYAAAVAPPKPSSAPKVEWSPPVKDYVSRAFMSDKKIVGIDNQQITQKLKDIITEAAEREQLNTIDWANFPLPQQILQMEMQKAQIEVDGGVPVIRAASLSLDDQTNGSKKRKSLEAELDDDDASLPPWRKKKNVGTSLADRMTFTDETQAGSDNKQKKIDEFRAHAPPRKFNDLEKRRQRFEASNNGTKSPYTPSSRDDSPMPDADAGPVVGTSEKLLKGYFRLTAPPKPETVRPLHILRRTLELLIQRWKESHDYGFICDQFKSLRQDLTVQFVKNEFTVRVYEAHARIALEKGDLGEYNQCQTQLRMLYKQKLGGCPGEFMAYRIFYVIYTRNLTVMNDVLADLTTGDKQHPAVQHALKVRYALSTGNYHRFFRLYEEPPNMGGYLMDMFVDRQRLLALANMARAYKPDLKLQDVSTELAFLDEQQCTQFIAEHGGEHLLEQREDGTRLLLGKAGNIFEDARRKAFGGVDIKGQI